MNNLLIFGSNYKSMTVFRSFPVFFFFFFFFIYFRNNSNYIRRGKRQKYWCFRYTIIQNTDTKRKNRKGRKRWNDKAEERWKAQNAAAENCLFTATQKTIVHNATYMVTLWFKAILYRCEQQLRIAERNEIFLSLLPLLVEEGPFDRNRIHRFSKQTFLI